MQRWLIGIGIACLALGLAWPVFERLGLGRLPGDIRIEREGFGFYFPLTTGILVSLLLSLLVWWWRR